MRKELPYFKVGASYGGNQNGYADPWMKRAGCAATTACELSIYLAKYCHLSCLCPFNPANQITQKDYNSFGKQMKPYLPPCYTGVDKLETYQAGLCHYLTDHGVNLAVQPWEGSKSLAETAEVVKQQIDKGIPIPCLVLKHRAPSMSSYVWHWFMLTGYEFEENTYKVKTVTYGHWHWVDLQTLWQTGYRRKGGLMILSA